MSQSPYVSEALKARLDSLPPQLAARIQAAADRFHAVLYALYPTVSVWKQTSFQDLRLKLEQLIHYDIDESMLTELSEEQKGEKIESLLERGITDRLETIRETLEKVESRNNVLSLLVKEKDELHKLLKPYLQIEDLKPQAETLVRSLEAIVIDQSLQNSPDIDDVIDKKRRTLYACKERIEKEVSEMQTLLQGLHQQVAAFQAVIMAARWEIVSCTTPYPDLRGTLEQIRTQFNSQVEQAHHNFMDGKLRLADYFDGVIRLMYEHNIKFIRGELMARSLRITDLRNAILEELLPLQRQLSLITLAGGASQELEHAHVWLLRLYMHLFDPYALFQDAFSPETIDTLFRYWWLDLERWKRGNEGRFRSFLIVASRQPNALVEPISRVLDAIEKCTDKALYRPFREAVAKKTGEALVSAIDRWLQDNSSDLLEKMVPQLALLHMPELGLSVERIAAIQSQGQEVISFARDLQAIKTFEPERIDAILEVFSLFPSFTTQQIPLIENGISIVNETLLLELGIIDRTSRLERGQAIIRLLPHALIKARSILESLHHEMTLLSAKPDPFVSKVAKRSQKEVTALSVTLPKLGFEMEPLFFAFQRLSMLIFLKRVLTQPLIPLTQREQILSMAENKEAGRSMALPSIPHLSFVPGDMSFFISG